MTFWDSSALLTLLIEQPGIEALGVLTEQDPDIVMWWATPVELVSGTCRTYREGAVDQTTFSRTLERIDRFAAKAEQVEPTEQVRRTSVRILRVHSLRAADALQLAAALVWVDNNTSGARFVCTDRRLREAAQREGFSVLPRD